MLLPKFRCFQQKFRYENKQESIAYTQKNKTVSRNCL